MIVVCDVDSVVADLITVWLSFYNQEYHDRLVKKDILSWDLSTYVKPECGKNIFKYIEDPNLYNFVAPEPMAQEGIKYLRNLGHRIVFVTSSTAGAQGAKLKWLRHWGFLDQGYKALRDYVEATDKSLILADVMIDDYIENLKTFGGRGVLFTQPWNEQFDWTPRINSWYSLINGQNPWRGK